MLKIGVAFGSFLGLIWQTILMTGLFLQYDVVNEVKISIPKNMSMDPSISICPFYASFLKKRVIWHLKGKRFDQDKR